MNETAALPLTKPRHGWVLYDGYCGFCSRWVPFWGPTLHRHGFDIATLEEPWVASALGLSDAALHTDIRLLLSNGAQRQGADVYRYVMARIWWALPFAVLANLPGLRRIFDGAYRLFADNRYWISRTCHMPVSRNKETGTRN